MIDFREKKQSDYLLDRSDISSARKFLSLLLEEFISNFCMNLDSKSTALLLHRLSYISLEGVPFNLILAMQCGFLLPSAHAIFQLSSDEVLSEEMVNFLQTRMKEYFALNQGGV